jgi:hypothetical protein
MLISGLPELVSKLPCLPGYSDVRMWESREKPTHWLLI